MLDLDARDPGVGAQARGQCVQAGAGTRAEGDQADLRDAEARRARARPRGDGRGGHPRVGRRPRGQCHQQAPGLGRLSMSRRRQDEPQREQAQ